MGRNFEGGGGGVADLGRIEIVIKMIRIRSKIRVILLREVGETI